MLGCVLVVAFNVFPGQFHSTGSDPPISRIFRFLLLYIFRINLSTSIALSSVHGSPLTGPLPSMSDTLPLWLINSLPGPCPA